MEVPKSEDVKDTHGFIKLNYNFEFFSVGSPVNL